jgi:hypothetical protein
MNRTAALVVVTLAAGTIALAQDLPLSVKLVTSSNQVELRNTGSQPINAWAFAVTSPNAGGGIHRVFQSADVYLSEVTGGLQGAAPHLNRLMPGESRLVPTDTPPAGASAQPVAVILQDNTAMGDEAQIASFFEKRAAERDQLKEVVDLLNAAAASAHGTAALEDLQRRLGTSSGEAESVPHRSAREAVAAWQQKAKTAGADELDGSIKAYASFVARQYDVAAQHAMRKR